jgi:hypothetical protein
MRISMQLRIPRGTADAERWRRSVYVDDTLRDITVFFDEMVPVGATTTRRPALDQVESVLFVVDSVNTMPGTAGRLVLDDIRYER